MDLYGVLVVWAHLLGSSIVMFIWVFVPFAIGYGLPFQATGRKSLNVMWVLAALALIFLIWAFNTAGAAYVGLAIPVLFGLAWGLVLACLIRELSLRRNLSSRVSAALTVAGFATMPAIVFGFNAYLLWASREASAACLATSQIVEVAGTRYRLPNVPIVLMPEEYNSTSDGFINQRLRNRCATAQRSKAMPIVSGFTLDLRYLAHRFQVTQKICAEPSAKPRWLVDACATRNQVDWVKQQETFVATHLPVELVVQKVDRPLARPYTVVEEHLSNLRMRDQWPYRELPGTAEFSIYAKGEHPHHGETRYWIRKEAATEPTALACRTVGQSADPFRVRCTVRYERGAALIKYEFLTEPGREQDRAAQVHVRVQDILAELAAPL